MTRIATLVLLLGVTHIVCGESKSMQKVHFLIPAGPGGGWNGTARGVGEAMIRMTALLWTACLPETTPTRQRIGLCLWPLQCINFIPNDARLLCNENLVQSGVYAWN